MSNIPSLEFTLVSTVFNEALRLDQTIQDINGQSIRPSEIIITDAGSNDGTFEKLLEWKDQSPTPVLIFQKKGCNVAEGRNLAIYNAKYNIIVSTDFGCRFHPEWLASIVAPFKDPSVQIVGGSYTVKENEQQTLAAKAFYILANGYKTDINALRFIPSSRSIAYKKKVFYDVGGYCEWLTLAADDLVFGKKVLAQGYKIYPVNKPYVFWGRHKNAKGFIKEAYRYGLGDGEAKVDLRNFFSNSIELILRYFLFLNILLTILSVWVFNINWFLCISFIIFLPGLRSYINYTINWLHLKSEKYNSKVFLYGFLLLEQTRTNYIKGFLNGYLFSTAYQKAQANLLNKKIKDKPLAQTKSFN